MVCSVSVSGNVRVDGSWSSCDVSEVGNMGVRFGWFRTVEFNFDPAHLTSSSTSSNIHSNA